MKTSKKILMLVTSLGITVAISIAITGILSIFWAFSFWAIVACLSGVQLAATITWDNMYESRRIVKAVQEYNSKPYRRYMIELNCAHCGSKNEVDVDLNETEFRCINCRKFNGIHVNFIAAAITEPVSAIVK